MADTCGSVSLYNRMSKLSFDRNGEFSRTRHPIYDHRNSPPTRCLRPAKRRQGRKLSGLFPIENRAGGLFHAFLYSLLPPAINSYQHTAAPFSFIVGRRNLLIQRVMCAFSLRIREHDAAFGCCCRPREAILTFGG